MNQRRFIPPVEPLEPRTLFAAFDVLVFSKTVDFRHASIANGIAAIEALGAANDFTVTKSENAADINPTNLANFECVVFLSTTGDFLNNTQQAAFEQYIAAGGGFVGIHGASDAERDWEWYGGLVGAYFDDHPDVQEATVNVATANHPATTGLPASWTRTDEWYNFESNPRSAGVTVLLTLDEDSYDGGTMGDDHPIAWSHEYAGGRAFYTAMGHTPETYADPLYRAHLLGGIVYAAGPLASQPPVAAASANATTGVAPLAVQFSSAGTTPGDHGPITFAWDFDTNGTIDSTDANPSFTYAQAGNFTATLTVTDQNSATSIAAVPITVTAPPTQNPAPVAANDTAATTTNAAVQINVLANDTDDDTINPAGIALVAQPSNGTVSLNAATGIVTYTPRSGFVGSDTFTYTVADLEGAVSNIAGVSITVAAVTAPPPEQVLEVTLTGTLPSAAVAGQKAKIRQSAAVRNLSASAFQGDVTIALYASLDETIDDADIAITSVTKSLKLRSLAGRSVPIKLSALPAAPDGSYRLLARATSPQGGTSNTSANPAAITIAAPFQDLSAGFSAITGIVRPNKRISAKLLLQNLGNVPAAGQVTFSLTAIASETYQVPLGDIVARVNLKPGKAKALALKFFSPQTPGTYIVAAVMQPAAPITDPNSANNSTTSSAMTVA